MKITFEHYDTVVSVGITNDNLAIDDVLEDLVIPVLVAAGFNLENIEEAMGERCGCKDGCCRESFD